MDSVLSLTPIQQFFVLAVNVWMFLIFPILVLRKLNHITRLLETSEYEDESGEEVTDDWAK